MNDIPRHNLLEELDTRQNELLDELDNLNRRVEQVLADCLAWRSPPASESPPAIALPVAA